MAKAQKDSLFLACLGRVLWQKHSALRSVVPLAVFVLFDISCSVIDISSLLDILSPKKQSLPPGQLHNAQSTAFYRLSSFFCPCLMIHLIHHDVILSRLLTTWTVAQSTASLAKLTSHSSPFLKSSPLKDDHHQSKTFVNQAQQKAKEFLLLRTQT